MSTKLQVTIAAATIVLAAGPAWTAGSDDRAGPAFGGPSSVAGQIEEDAASREPALRFPGIDDWLDPWFAWKQRVADVHGFQFGLDYNTLYQSLSRSLTDEKRAWSGVVRAYGTWTLLRRGESDAGWLVWKVDHRHRIGTALAPNNIAGEAGYIGVTGTLFSDVDLVLVDLAWQMSFNDRRSGLMVGRFDPNDYMGVLGYVNPWTTFSNAWTLLNGSAFLPDMGWGVAGGHWFTDEWYALAALNDANGLLTDVEFYKGGAEFFTFGEIGWSPAKTQRYTHNVHVMGWHVDDREDSGLESAHGFTLGANWTTADERWMGFVRGGWSEGTVQAYDRTATLGFMRKFRRNSDLIGLAVNWGGPPDDSLSDQTTGEVFYRFQFSQNVALTPSLQLLGRPSLNPEHDSVWVFGLRGRITL